MCGCRGKRGCLFSDVIRAGLIEKELPSSSLNGHSKQWEELSAKALGQECCVCHMPGTPRTPACLWRSQRGGEQQEMRSRGERGLDCVALAQTLGFHLTKMGTASGGLGICVEEREECGVLSKGVILDLVYILKGLTPAVMLQKGCRRARTDNRGSVIRVSKESSNRGDVNNQLQIRFEGRTNRIS